MKIKNNVTTVTGAATGIARGGSLCLATKFPLSGKSEALRKELFESGSKIRVSSDSSGLVAKPEGFIFPDNLVRKRLDRNEIANSVLFVCQRPAQVSIQDIVVTALKQYD